MLISCSGKRGYDTYQEAEHAIRDTKLHPGALTFQSGKRLAPYRCRKCRQWHIGHMDRKHARC